MHYLPIIAEFATFLTEVDNEVADGRDNEVADGRDDEVADGLDYGKADGLDDVETEKCGTVI